MYVYQITSTIEKGVGEYICIYMMKLSLGIFGTFGCSNKVGGGRKIINNFSVIKIRRKKMIMKIWRKEGGIIVGQPKKANTHGTRNCAQSANDRDKPCGDLER